MVAQTKMQKNFMYTSKIENRAQKNNYFKKITNL